MIAHSQCARTPPSCSPIRNAHAHHRASSTRSMGPSCAWAGLSTVGLMYGKGQPYGLIWIVSQTDGGPTPRMRAAARVTQAGRLQCTPIALRPTPCSPALAPACQLQPCQPYDAFRQKGGKGRQGCDVKVVGTCQQVRGLSTGAGPNCAPCRRATCLMSRWCTCTSQATTWGCRCGRPNQSQRNLLACPPSTTWQEEDQPLVALPLPPATVSPRQQPRPFTPNPPPCHAPPPFPTRPGAAAGIMQLLGSGGLGGELSMSCTIRPNPTPRLNGLCSMRRPPVHARRATRSR